MQFCEMNKLLSFRYNVKYAWRLENILKATDFEGHSLSEMIYYMT